MHHSDLVERYYEAIDANDGDALESVLAPEFRHLRPDRTLEGRDCFLEFMLTERPNTETVHAVEELFIPATQESVNPEEVAVHGRLLEADGTELFAFVDLFTVGEAGIVRLKTFTD